MTITTRTGKGSALSHAEMDANLTELNSRAAKAWVNFNGTGTVAIRQAYNVASITDNGVGDYTINIPAGVMPDGDYTISGGGKFPSFGDANVPVIGINRSVAPTATACRIYSISAINTLTVYDMEIVSVALFR